MKKFIIGVDGGNTKTDYLLYDTEGNFIDGVRSGTCSHEVPSVGGFDRRIIKPESFING